MKSKKLYIIMSIFIVVMVGGGTFVSVYWEDIKIQYWIWKLDSKSQEEREEAFWWLRKLAEKNLEDKRLKGFFKHPESRKQLEVDTVWAFETLGERKEFTTLGFLLSFAVAGGDLVNIKIMLEHGADVNAKDKNGKTPLDYVGDDNYIPQKKKQEIKTLLRKYGAKSGAELKVEAEAKK